MTEEFVGYTDKLLKYIEQIKQETKLEICILFYGNSFAAYYENPPFPCKL